MKHIHITAAALCLSAGIALPIAAQTGGVWRDDLAVLSYPPEVVGGYWDAGYDFNFMLYCSASEPWLNVGFGFVNVQPDADYQVFFVQLGDRRFDIPWIDSGGMSGSVSGYYPHDPLSGPWSGQEDFIQRLLDGHSLRLMEGASIDDPNPTQWAVADPAPGLAMFQALSRTCGSGVVTPQSVVAPLPPPQETGASTWVLGAGTELWDGLTAFSPSDNGEAQGFVHCGADGQAEFVLRVTEVDAPSDTNFGGAYIGADVFEIVAGNWGGAYVFDVSPDMIGAMMAGRALHFDSLIPVYEPVDTVVTFSLAGAQPILEQALAPCAGSALP